MVDPKADPCDDFYQFACGTFISNSISHGEASIVNDMKELTDTQIENLISQDIEDDQYLPKSFRYQRKFYRMCMNTTAIEEEKDRTFLDTLEELIGGWPLAKGHAMQFSWSEAMVNARKMGLKFNYFLGVRVQPMPKENQVYLKLGPPPKCNFDEDVWKEENIPLFLEMASEWGSPSPSARTEMLKTIEFYKEFKKIVDKAYNATKDIKPEHKKSTIARLKHLQLIRLPWLQFLRDITGFEHLKEEDTIIVDITQEYLTDLYYLLLRTEHKFVSNYIATLLILEDYGFLTKKIARLGMKIEDRPDYKNRREYCLSKTKTTFDSVADALYVRKFVNGDNKMAVEEMVKSIRRELEVGLEGNEWMDSVTKVEAKKFLENVTAHVGWTDLVYNEERTEQYFGYHKLHLEFTNITSVNKQMMRFRTDMYYEMNVGTFEDQLSAFVHSPYTDVNAFYLKFYNILILAAPLLQPPIFDRDAPKYINYGALGSIIGHELTHAFSEEQSEYTEYFGKDRSFWTNDTSDMYEEASRCIVEEVESYDKHVEGFSDNATITWEENVADLTGINLAYTAYQKWVLSNGLEPNLPGVPFSPNQMFWIMASTYLCYDPKAGGAKHFADLSHSSPRFRVISAIKNSPHFAKDYECATGREMNPTQKCRIFA
ncbi:neprilysin-2-like isoform X2 [Cylas formicarius]|nr:neprilysin-2-like isoform X2 [Cylas formicarius]